MNNKLFNKENSEYWLTFITEKDTLITAPCSTFEMKCLEANISGQEQN